MPPQNQDPNQVPQPSGPNPASGFDPNQNNQPQQTPPPQPVAANGAQTPPNPYNSPPDGVQSPQPTQAQPAPYQQPPYDNSGSSGIPPQDMNQNPDMATTPQPTEPIPPEVPITTPTSAGDNKTKKIVIISAIVTGVLLLLVAMFSLLFTDPPSNGNGTPGTSVEEDAFNGDTDPASPDEVPGPGGGNGDDLDFL